MQTLPCSVLRHAPVKHDDCMHQRNLIKYACGLICKVELMLIFYLRNCPLCTGKDSEAFLRLCTAPASSVFVMELVTALAVYRSMSARRYPVSILTHVGVLDIFKMQHSSTSPYLLYQCYISTSRLYGSPSCACMPRLSLCLPYTLS